MTVNVGGAVSDGEPQRLPVSGVEAALARRWAAIVQQYPNARSHANSINLVTCVNERDAAPAVSEIVHELSAAHPIRAITTVEDDAAPEDSVSAGVTDSACVGHDGVPCCSEEVFLYGNPGAAERIASAVFGLLEGDMPVYLWWRGPSPYGNPLFRLVAPFADKIIIDSMRFGDTAAALDTVRRMAEHRAGHVAVADLNWKRIQPWRQTIAACFDDPQTATLLASFDRCEITFATGAARGAPPGARATLLAGWIARSVPRLRARTRVVAQPSLDEASGRIEAVCFFSAGSKAELGLKRVEAPLRIDARASDAAAVQFRQWSFPAKTLDEAELLHLSLDDPARDPVFEASLAQT